MTEDSILTALASVGGTGIFAWILYRLLEKVLERQAIESTKLFDVLLAALQANTVAMTRVEVAIATVAALPERLDQIMERMHTNSIADDKRDDRLARLEGNKDG